LATPQFSTTGNIGIEALGNNAQDKEKVLNFQARL